MGSHSIFGQNTKQDIHVKQNNMAPGGLRGELHYIPVASPWLVSFLPVISMWLRDPISGLFFAESGLNK
jgi:hypothetical protein